MKANPEAVPRLQAISAMDFLPQAQLRALQRDRLQTIVRHTFDNVQLFRERMLERGLTPDAISSLEDIQRLPFTVKTDLRDTYPFGLFAVPMKDVVRLHASSGMTGKPIVVSYTRQDKDMWAEVMMRAFASYGVTQNDIVQNAYGYGLFTGGLGAHYGAEALGAMVIPISSGNTDRQLMTIRDFGVTVICSTPSYFLRLIERAGELGIDLMSLPLSVGVFGAEPWTEAMRKRIENGAGIKAYDIYGLSEIIGPGVGAECYCQHGLHIFEDHFYPEIIDPRTLEPLADGEEGELVFTTLTKWAMPMIRYRTRDITRIIAEPCPCGRTVRRIARISRRSDDMIIIRGVNVFPSQVEAALLAAEETLPHYQIVLTNDGTLDRMEVQVEVTPAILSDKVGALRELQERLAQSIERIVNLRIPVRLVEPNTIARSEGKARRVIDNRPK
ncbi:MAG: phenylacetate--CoA ligase [Candidatus Hydrogenedentes bacterium]|nr:phenylacetate--CoA ligase [Candidatus Hydrogenedentota bacterium]